MDTARECDGRKEQQPKKARCEHDRSYGGHGVRNEAMHRDEGGGGVQAAWVEIEEAGHKKV